jgi:transcriptional regulator with XRE-family HTH domain
VLYQRRSEPCASAIESLHTSGERRYELELTQAELATRAGTSHSSISKLERGDHIPTIPVLAVLDERLLLGIERDVSDAEPEREFAIAPDIAGG